MGLRARLAAFIGGDSYQNAVTFTPELEEAIRRHSSNSGVQVTYLKALQVSTVMRCAAIISDDLCSVPWKLYRKVGTRRVEERSHPLWDLIHSSPNDWQTSFEFRKTIGLHLALTGNAYVWLNRVRGKIIEMIPFEPNMVTVRRNPDWSLEYRLTFPDGTQALIPAKDIWHLKNHSWDSYKGLSALSYAREAIGLSIAIEEGQAKTHKDGVRPSGILTVDQVLDETQFKAFRKMVDLQYGGRLNAGKPMVLDKTTKWEQLSMTGVESQTIETRGFQIEEICRGMGILPIMVGYTGDKGSTYASAEQMFIAHYKTSTRVWHRNVEQSGDKHLLSRADRADGYYTGFVDQELLRGDSKARGEFYKLLWMIGAITGNEVRGMEEMDEIEGLDRPWAPLNSAPIGTDGMPMVADTTAPATQALLALLRGHPDADLADNFLEAFKASDPVAQQMFLSHLSAETQPSAGH